MRIPRSLFAITALALMLVGCRGSSTPTTCPPMAVHPVRFVGNAALTADELRVPFRSLERMELPWPTLVTTAFADALHAALIDLRQLFLDRGYLDASVRDRTYVPSADRQWIDVTVSIDEGKRFRLGALTLRDIGGPALVDPIAACASFPLKTGDWYSQRALDVGMSAVLGAYADRGVGARATAVRSFDGPKAYGGEAVDVVIEVERRPAIDRVAKIEVYGVASEARERAMAAALGLRIGDRIDRARLEDAKRRLMAAGDFGSLEVQAYDIDDHPGDREIEVLVGERVPLPP